MQTYIVRVYRALPANDGSVSGIIEDTESGQKESFHGLDGLRSLLAHSIMKGQCGPQFSDIAGVRMGCEKGGNES